MAQKDIHVAVKDAACLDIMEPLVSGSMDKLLQTSSAQVLGRM